MGRPRILPDKTCICGTIFRPKDSLKKFCSPKCFYENREKKGKWIDCICGKKVWAFPRDFKGNRFCSKECGYKSKIIEDSKVKLECYKCGKEYEVYKKYLDKRVSKFCSVKCMGLSMRLKRHPGWKGGQALKKNLWIVFSQYIRQRDKGVCISCGKVDFWRKTDAGHYIPKTAGLSIYFDEQNVHCQCTYCNRWMHGNLTKYALALKQRYGDGILEELDKKRATIRKISTKEYSELLDIYKEKLKNVVESKS